MSLRFSLRLCMRISAHHPSENRLDEGDLPFLPADLRSSNVFLKIKVQPESRSLALRLLSANAWNLTVSSTLSAVVAALYYAPALFLNLLVTYLEKDPENRPPQAVGFAYAVGLFVVLAADAILEGQLWLLASGFLASKVRMQLNTLVFEKVLRRKDFTGASRSSEDDDDDVDDQAAAVTPAQKANGKTPPKEDEEEEVDEEDQNFTSKNQCMTVFSVDVDRVARTSCPCLQPRTVPDSKLCRVCRLWPDACGCTAGVARRMLLLVPFARLSGIARHCYFHFVSASQPLC